MRTAWQGEKGEDKAVTSPLSLIITAFTPVLDVRKTVTPELKTNVDSAIICIDLGQGKNRLGASIFAQVYNQIGQTPADADSAEQLKAFFNAMQLCLQNELLLAYHDRSDGGLFAALAEMSFAGRSGLNIDLTPLGEDSHAVLFNEELGGVVQVAVDKVSAVMQIFADAGLAGMVSNIGSVTADETLSINNQGREIYTTARAQLQELWTKTSLKEWNLLEGEKYVNVDKYRILQELYFSINIYETIIKRNLG